MAELSGRALDAALETALETSYSSFERRLLSEEAGHGECLFRFHARTCYEEAFRAGWLAALAAERERRHAQASGR